MQNLRLRANTRKLSLYCTSRLSEGTKLKNVSGSIFQIFEETLSNFCLKTRWLEV